MTVATRTDSSLAATITQTSLYTAIKTAFTNAGYASTPYDDTTSGTDKILVYEYVNDASKVYGKTYIRIRITTALVIGQQLYTSWNAGNHSGTNNSTEVTFSALSTSINIAFVSLNGTNVNGVSEYKLVLLTQSAFFIPLGIVAPTNKPDWWSLDSWSYGFIFTNTTVNILRMANLSPYSSNDFDTFLNNTRLGTANTQTNRRDILTGIVLLSQSNAGAGCRTSDDLAMVSANGSTRYDLFQKFGTSEQYLVINPVAGGLGIRTS